MQDPNPPGSEKDTTEGKGFRREAESEEGRMWEQINYDQTSSLTNGNNIQSEEEEKDTRITFETRIEKYLSIGDSYSRGKISLL